jgi:2-oxoglutarate ferredoxin oxidoreductase subunit gamma
MQTEIIFSGFGGQGALFAGQLLAYAAMDAGRHVTWIPSYGPEMRGGTAHCTVIVSDDEIGSPLVRHPAAAVVLNRPSFDKYEPLVAPGGVLVVNSSLVDQVSARDDLRAIAVPANAIAEALGDTRLANMVLSGALVEATGVLPFDALAAALARHLPERHRRLLDANREALRRGQAIARSVQPQLEPI